MSTLSPARHLAATTPAADTTSPPADPVATRRLRLAGRLVAVLVCACHAYSNRHLINPDGVSYLDVAGAYLRGDWANAVNSYWSPLYSWLLAGVMAVARPGPYWECAAAHGLNFAAFLLALAAFEGLLSEVLRARDEERAGLRATWQDLLPDWLVVGVSYTLFVVVSRRLVTVSAVTPDMLVLAGTLAATMLVLRLRRRRSVLAAGLLGAVLGLAYLAKAVMFPMALVFLGLALLVTGRRGVGPFTAAALGFALLAGPWVAVLSVSAGKPTFGESGRLNYLWYVNGLERPAGLAGRDRPLPPGAPRPLTRGPLLVENAPRGAATYPHWYDPARYYEGVAPRFEAGRQVAASAKVLAYYYALFAERLLAWTMAVVALVCFGYLARRGGSLAWLRGWAAACGRAGPLLLPAGAGLTLYLIVGHAEGRLVGPFVLLLGLGLLTTVRLPYPRQASVRPVGGAVLACLFALVAINAGFDVATAARASERPEAHPHHRVAGHLHALGLEPGDKVASIGFTYNAYWARLGGFGVVAEMTTNEAAGFWAAPAIAKTRVLNACRLAGARAVICDACPAGAEGWSAVPDTTYGVRLLENDEAGAAVAEAEFLGRPFRREP